MRVGRHKRQLLLFLAAILLPACVLIGLAARIIVQERELDAKRVTDERRHALAQVRRELSARLEAIKLQEINRLIRAPGSWTEGPQNSSVIFLAKVEYDRVILPWEAASESRRSPSPQFLRHWQEGERQEFIHKDNPSAIRAYSAALQATRQPAERAAARLLLARALAKAGEAEQSFRNYRGLLEAGELLRDDQGVAYQLYAAERLLEAKQDQEAITALLIKQVNSLGWLSLPEMHLIRSMLGLAAGRQAAQARETITRRTDQMEQAMELVRDFPRLWAQLESGEPSSPVWAGYGTEPLLVTTTPPASPLPALLIVVSSIQAAPPGVKLESRSSKGDPLGDGFLRVWAKLTSTRVDEASRQGTPLALYLAGLGLVLGITVVAGYLLLRDVNREMRLTEVRSQFVAGVSHELKTPLTSIRMFAETLSLGLVTNESMRSEYLETIVNESERLARLVDNVLDFSKIEQGKKMYRLRPVSLARVVDSAARTMQYPLAQQGFTLRLANDEAMPLFQADPDAIEQAILNLLTNAMKFSANAREIDLRLTSRNGDAVIEVTDRGLGIALHEQKHVFEKFYRAPSHETSVAGTGLGLTLVAHIAAAHGGRVEMRSEPGAGSTFSILIPIEGRI